MSDGPVKMGPSLEDSDRVRRLMGLPTQLSVDNPRTRKADPSRKKKRQMAKASRKRNR